MRHCEVSEKKYPDLWHFPSMGYTSQLWLVSNDRGAIDMELGETALGNRCNLAVCVRLTAKLTHMILFSPVESSVN